MTPELNNCFNALNQITQNHQNGNFDKNKLSKLFEQCLEGIVKEESRSKLSKEITILHRFLDTPLGQTIEMKDIPKYVADLLEQKRKQQQLKNNLLYRSLSKESRKIVKATIKKLASEEITRKVIEWAALFEKKDIKKCEHFCESHDKKLLMLSELWLEGGKDKVKAIVSLIKQLPDFKVNTSLENKVSFSSFALVYLLGEEKDYDNFSFKTKDFEKIKKSLSEKIRLIESLTQPQVLPLLKSCYLSFFQAIILLKEAPKLLQALAELSVTSYSSLPIYFSVYDKKLDESLTNSILPARLISLLGPQFLPLLNEFFHTMEPKRQRILLPLVDHLYRELKREHNNRGLIEKTGDILEKTLAYPNPELTDALAKLPKEKIPLWCQWIRASKVPSLVDFIEFLIKKNEKDLAGEIAPWADEKTFKQKLDLQFKNDPKSQKSYKSWMAQFKEDIPLGCNKLIFELLEISEKTPGLFASVMEIASKQHSPLSLISLNRILKEHSDQAILHRILSFSQKEFDFPLHLNLWKKQGLTPEICFELIDSIGEEKFTYIMRNSALHGPIFTQLGKALKQENHRLESIFKLPNDECLQMLEVLFPIILEQPRNLFSFFSLTATTGLKDSFIKELIDPEFRKLIIGLKKPLSPETYSQILSRLKSDPTYCHQLLRLCGPYQNTFSHLSKSRKLFESLSEIEKHLGLSHPVVDHLLHLFNVGDVDMANHYLKVAGEKKWDLLLRLVDMNRVSSNEDMTALFEYLENHNNEKLAGFVSSANAGAVKALLNLREETDKLLIERMQKGKHLNQLDRNLLLLHARGHKVMIDTLLKNPEHHLHIFKLISEGHIETAVCEFNGDAKEVFYDLETNHKSFEYVATIGQSPEKKRSDIAFALAHYLIDQEGGLHFGRIPQLQKKHLPISAECRSHVDRVLNLLLKNRDLAALLTAAPIPKVKSPQDIMVRKALNIHEDETITKRHIRALLLSAILTPTRQSDVGSCFGTCLTIQQESGLIGILQIMKDFLAILESGGLTRNQTFYPINIESHYLKIIFSTGHPLSRLREYTVATMGAEDAGTSMSIKQPIHKICDAIADFLHQFDKNIASHSGNADKLKKDFLSELTYKYVYDASKSKPEKPEDGRGAWILIDTESGKPVENLNDFRTLILKALPFIEQSLAEQLPAHEHEIKQFMQSEIIPWINSDHFICTIWNDLYLMVLEDYSVDFDRLAAINPIRHYQKLGNTPWCLFQGGLSERVFNTYYERNDMNDFSGSQCLSQESLVNSLLNFIHNLPVAIKEACKKNPRQLVYLGMPGHALSLKPHKILKYLSSYENSDSLLSALKEQTKKWQEAEITPQDHKQIFDNLAKEATEEQKPVLKEMLQNMIEKPCTLSEYIQICKNKLRSKALSKFHLQNILLALASEIASLPRMRKIRPKVIEIADTNWQSPRSHMAITGNPVTGKAMIVLTDEKHQQFKPINEVALLGNWQLPREIIFPDEFSIN